MNGVLATFDRDNGTWSFESDYGIRDVPIMVGVAGGGPLMVGAHLGFVAVQDGVTLNDYVYPPAGQRLISSDQPYVARSGLDIPKDSEVAVTFFFEEGEERSSEEFVFVPKTTPYPTDGREYVWEYDVWVPVS